MKGIIYAIAAGVFICLQAVFNTRLGEKVGFWETNTFVHVSGLLLSVIILLSTGNISFAGIREVNKLYLLGGALGVFIIFCVMNTISKLGAAFGVAIMLITQLIAATIIDCFGLFGSPVMKFDMTKLLGITIMIAGIVVFKLKG